MLALPQLFSSRKLRRDSLLERRLRFFDFFTYSCFREQIDAIEDVNEKKKHAEKAQICFSVEKMQLCVDEIQRTKTIHNFSTLFI